MSDRGAYDPGGVSDLGGMSDPGGGSDAGGLSTSDTPPMNRMTDRCKNITLATTSLRPVKMCALFQTLYSFLIVAIFSHVFS